MEAFVTFHSLWMQEGDEDRLAVSCSIRKASAWISHTAIGFCPVKYQYSSTTKMSPTDGASTCSKFFAGSKASKVEQEQTSGEALNVSGGENMNQPSAEQLSSVVNPSTGVDTPVNRSNPNDELDQELVVTKSTPTTASKHDTDDEKATVSIETKASEIVESYHADEDVTGVDIPAALANNPFARFAAASTDSAPKQSIDLSGWVAPPRKKPKVVDPKKWVRMADLPHDEQERVVAKWHGLLVGSPSRREVEDDRFQIFTAAQLHRRCQEGPVRQAMQALYAHFNSTLTVERMAQADPEEWKDAISNLQYYPTKARQLQKASQDIIQNFGGKVPERDHDLQKLTGIGPVLADLLAFVNTRRVHNDRQD